MIKGKYKIVKDGGKEYILVSDVPAYAKEHFNSSFDIPSYRTIRYYVSHGVWIRPNKLGRETYFEINYVIGAIENLKNQRYKRKLK